MTRSIGVRRPLYISFCCEYLCAKPTFQKMWCEHCFSCLRSGIAEIRMEMHCDVDAQPLSTPPVKHLALASNLCITFPYLLPSISLPVRIIIKAPTSGCFLCSSTSANTVISAHHTPTVAKTPNPTHKPPSSSAQTAHRASSTSNPHRYS